MQPRRLGKKQYLVPYLMSSHPGSTLKDAVSLAEYLRDLGYMPEQAAGFLSHAVHHFYLHVLYRAWIPQTDGSGVCAEGVPMKRPCSGR